MTQTGSRERSSIRFPYGDLEDAVQVATTMNQRLGRTAELDQLAAAIGQSVSGAFRAKVATAVTFGVVETGRGEVTLTDLGARIADPQTEAQARVEAFLTVPLYERVVERYKGGRLPEDQGFERDLVHLGVSPKQARKARQALQRSAEQAGFFSLGRDRLVRPATVGRVESPVAEKPAPPPPGVPAGLTQHPLIVGLWQMLPEPAPGALTPEQQAEWIEAAKINLRLLYGAGAKTGVPPSHGQTPAENSSPDETRA